MKLKKGDKVTVTAGKSKGAEGTIEKVYVKQNKVLVAGVNIYKKHIKKNEQMPQGGVVELPRPLDAAKVGYKCSKCKKITRIGYKLDGDKKIRICRKCGEQL